MRFITLKNRLKRLYFSVEDLGRILGIKQESARVLCTRYTRNGLFVRLKKDLYMLDEKWRTLSKEEFFVISNILQVPSYISFTTALSYYGITTQVQRDYFESASLKRSIEFNINGVIFSYHKIQHTYYFDFVRQNNIFIATPEKAFMDSVYLYSLGRYALDFSAIDMDKLDIKKISSLSEPYPQKTKRLIKKICMTP